MAKLVTVGAMLKCSEGMAVSALVVPQPLMKAGNKSIASTEDNMPLVNVMPFGMCKSLANPQVAAATAAAQGVLTPVPCLPMIAAPFSPGASGIKVLKKTMLSHTSSCRCNWNGTIELVESDSPFKVNE